MAPPEMHWLRDPQLFLLSQGGVAQVWKCKKSNPILQPMKQDDFELVGKVTDHLELIEYMFKWDPKKYHELVTFISERNLLVNGQGVLIAQLHKYGEDDGKMDATQLPIYIRSLHILCLKTYIHGFMERPIPFRMTQFLKDKNGRVVPVEFSPKEVKLNEDIKDVKKEKMRLDKEIAGLKADIKTNEANIKKLNANITAQITRIANIKLERSRVKTELDTKIAGLEYTNRNLNAQVERLNGEITRETTELGRLQQELIGVNTEKQARDKRAIELQNEINSLKWILCDLGC